MPGGRRPARRHVPMAGRVHHRQRRARRPRRRFLGGRRPRVHRDRELDRAAELPGERVDDKRTQPGLQLLLDEGVRRRDQHGVLHQAERPGEFRLEPGELAGPDVHLGEPLEGSCPYLRQIQFAHRCAPLASPHCPSAVTSIVDRNSLSTGPSTRCVRALNRGFAGPSGGQLPSGGPADVDFPQPKWPAADALWKSQCSTRVARRGTCLAGRGPRAGAGLTCARIPFTVNRLSHVTAAAVAGPVDLPESGRVAPGMIWPDP